MLKKNGSVHYILALKVAITTMSSTHTSHTDSSSRCPFCFDQTLKVHSVSFHFPYNALKEESRVLRQRIENFESRGKVKETAQDNETWTIEERVAAAVAKGTVEYYGHLWWC